MSESVDYHFNDGTNSAGQAVEQKFWCGRVPERDDFGDRIEDEFIDGKTRYGPWATMTPRSWRIEGVSTAPLGPGYGQRYKRQANGRWLKVEG
jgi:hypothetical protein